MEKPKRKEKEKENETKQDKVKIFGRICVEMFSGEMWKNLVYLIHSDLDSSYISKENLGSSGEKSHEGATDVAQGENTRPACTEL